MSKMIRRYADMEYRSVGNERQIEGVAVVFNEETDLDRFYETIDKHAFDNCDMSDVYCLFNHDQNYPLARTKNGSLELFVEDNGLRQIATVIETTKGNDILKNVREGLIDKMSFAFSIDLDHGDEWFTDAEGKEHRRILKIDKLYDVSPVTFPAYPTTSLAARNIDELDELAQEHLKGKEGRAMEEIKEEVAEVVEEVQEEHQEVVEEVVDEEETTEETEEVVEETTEETIEESTENVEENVEEEGEERNMNTTFENVQSRHEEVQNWRKSVMTMIAEERAGVKSTDSGVPIPTVFQGYIERAWEKVDLLDELTISSIKGIFKVSYEASADGAGYHAEGAEAPTEESLVLGTITLLPKMIKKWISVTDELESMADEEFMKYIAEEVVYQILKFAQAQVLVGNASSDGIVGIENATLTTKVVSTLGFNSINDALSEVDAGANPLVVMNRRTFFKNFMSLADTAGRPIYQIATDNTGKPQYFINGIRVKFNDALPAYDDVTTEAWAIVGDFKAYRLNLPNGRNVQTLFDPYTLATQDKSRMIGKLFASGNVCKPKALAKLTKA